MKECRWCKQSIASLLDGKPQIVCLFWRRKADEPCREYEREPGTDDEISQPGDGQTSPDHFHQPIQEIGR